MKFSLKDKNLLKIIYRFAKARKIKLYLVGGILRDLLLARRKENPDFDFCIKRGAINFGRKLAGKLKAGFVVLDKEHGACRLVKRIKDKTYTLDFTDFRGKNLEEDLGHRDFTINALALRLEDAIGQKDLEGLLIDPYDGREDLKKKLIKVVSKTAFAEDPLRILRTFSLACIFGFKIDKNTLTLARKARDKLKDVSGERIRDELFKVFSCPCGFQYLEALDKLKILQVTFPQTRPMHGIGQGPYHHLDVWQHTLETIKQLEILIAENKNKEVQNYLEENISAERKRRDLIKLAAFLHDFGKPATLERKDGKTTFHGHERVGLAMAEDVGRRLKLSNSEINALKIMVLRHLRPGYLADNAVLTPRAIFRFFRDAQDEAVAILLLSIADQRATKGPLTSRASRIHHEKTAFGLMREYFRRKNEKKAPRLLGGDDLIKKFKLAPSPLIGKILSEIEELQAIGKLKTKKEALKIAEKFIK